ncbi:chitin synthase-domain-containing protein [Blastocladiella britannica]|nr:chitin synthase-domain-containing protein [Blastocladiella britannica]
MSRETTQLKGGEESTVELGIKTARSTDFLSPASRAAGASSNALSDNKSTNRFALAGQNGKKAAAQKIAGKPERLKKSVRPDNVLLGFQTQERKLWLFGVTVLTGWIPNWALHLAGIKGQDVIIAWREKLTLCLIVGFASVLAIGWLEVSSSVLCPQLPNAYTWDAVARQPTWVVANGKVLDFTRSKTNIGRVLSKYPGKDVSSMFPTYARLGHPSSNSSAYTDTEINNCVTSSSAADNWVFNRITSDWTHTLNLTAEGALVGCPSPSGVAGAVESCYYSDAAWRDFTHMTIGDLKLDRDRLARTFGQTNMPIYAQLVGKVYDMTQYLRFAVLYQTDNVATTTFANVTIIPLTLSMFLPLDMTLDLARAAGGDVSNTTSFSQASAGSIYIPCMNKLFYAGVVQPKIYEDICKAGNPILLFSSGCVYAIVVVKFLVSLMFHFGVKPAQMNAYVMCFVPCYTEGYSMKVTLETLAESDYDDAKKLIVVVCDGNLKGKGNPAPTPAIALDMLGWKGQEPEPQMYHALGKGGDKINMGKAYSGWYTHKTHRVPFLVIAKVGKPDEAKKPKPGNRGKRDSQLIIMNFFNKLVNKKPMSPFEYDMYYHIKHVIGNDPLLYEYCLMVDADTKVEPDSMNELVAAMVNDQRKIGVCGETRVANKWASWVTAVQVHEYYINHHLGKAFESMFGSVTCLPGCFSMYRVCNAKGQSFLVDDAIIEDYSMNRVTTLHAKNLLHLGEDRYLTTLLLKHFPNHRLEFIPSAVCETDIPDSFSVLLSQRRRWINSTFHNLYEVMKLPRLCSFCFISMKTLVFMDLLSTLILPASTAYLYSIIIRAIIGGAEGWNQYGIVLLGALGLYATHLVIILLVKRQYEYCFWITVYIVLGMPIYSILLPVYAFWHFDDFSWGATRMIEGADDGHHGGDASGIIKNIEVLNIAEYETADQRLLNKPSKGAATTEVGNNIVATAPSTPAGGVPPVPQSMMMVMAGPNGGGGHAMGQMMYMQAAPGQLQQQQQQYVMYQPMMVGPHMSPTNMMPMGMMQAPPPTPQSAMYGGPGTTVPLAPMDPPKATAMLVGSPGSEIEVPPPPPTMPTFATHQPTGAAAAARPDIQYLSQGPPPSAVANTMGATVGAAFDQLFRELQGPPPGPGAGGGGNRMGTVNQMPQQYPQPQQQHQMGYQQQQVPQQQQGYGGTVRGAAPPPPPPGPSPVTGYAHPQQQQQQQPSPMGYQTQNMSGNPAAASGGTQAFGGTVGAAFAQAFQDLQEGM